jgi:DNA polymerase III epsilon subunit-like protein
MTSRERAIAWAKAVAADPTAVFVDTETTGLGPEAELCDLAIVGIDGRVLLDSLVLPLGPIPAEATAVHGITIAQCERAKAPMWKELWPRVAVLLRPARRVCVYNASYDFGIVQQVTKAARLPEFVPGWQCAMRWYAEFDGTPAFGRPGMKWHKLSNACAAMGVELSGAHRALADAEACRRLVLAIARGG